MRLRMVHGDQSMRLQVMMGTCVTWELEIVEHDGTVLVTSPNVEGGPWEGVDKALRPGGCKDAARKDASRVDLDGRAGLRMAWNHAKQGASAPKPVGSVSLLRSGEVWLSLEGGLHGGRSDEGGAGGGSDVGASTW